MLKCFFFAASLLYNRTCSLFIWPSSIGPIVGSRRQSFDWLKGAITSFPPHIQKDQTRVGAFFIAKDPPKEFSLDLLQKKLRRGNRGWKTIGFAFNQYNISSSFWTAPLLGLVLSCTRRPKAYPHSPTTVTGHSTAQVFGALVEPGISFHQDERGYSPEASNRSTYDVQPFLSKVRKGPNSTA